MRHAIGLIRTVINAAPAVAAAVVARPPAIAAGDRGNDGDGEAVAAAAAAMSY